MYVFLASAAISDGFGFEGGIVNLAARVEGRDIKERWKQIRTLTDKDNNEEAL